MADAAPDPSASPLAGVPALAPLLGRPAPAVEPVQRLEHTRSVFWQNVVRELLVGLPALAARHPQMMDGRIAVLTRAGERIPIGGVEPLFPCSVSSPETMQLCMAVQCTVFNIRTPTGEVFTLPLEEIRGVHTLTEDLIRQIEQAAKQVAGEDADEPFGFAAFTSLAKQAQNKSSTEPKSSSKNKAG